MTHCDSLGSLYEQHHGWLQAWLMRKLGNRADAADLAQDTFVRLLARDTRIAPAPDGCHDHLARGYLAVVAKGLVVSLWRRRAIEHAYLEALRHLPEAQAPSPETQAIVIETLCQIDTLLARLPAKVRQAFILAQADGMSQADIAERLGVSERMVRKYMAQAMAHCMLVEAGAW